MSRTHTSFSPAIAPVLAELLSAPGGGTLLIHAAAVADGSGWRRSPGSVLVHVQRSATDERETTGGPPAEPPISLLAAGSPREVIDHPRAARAARVTLENAVLLPALVNAHTHLDLTHVGPRPFEPAGGFVGWVDVVRKSRAAEPADIDRSVARGVELLRRGGVAAVGDIAGCPMTGPTARAAHAAARAGMSGVSFVEFFGMGRGRERGLERASACFAEASGREFASSALRLGLQPHATNTVAPDIFRQALARLDVPLSTHLAETPEEHEFIAAGTGPQRDLLERIGVWDESVLRDVGQGRTPVEHLCHVLAGAGGRTAPIILAHVNDCADADLERLAALRAAGIDLHVAYCPRASTYFGAAGHFGPHRYREMHARGIPVALGTDSIINLGAETEREGISTWSEMRLLLERDGVEASELLTMASTAGAAALGMDPGLFRLSMSGAIAGLLAVTVTEPPGMSDPVRAAIMGGQPPQFLLDKNYSCMTET